MSMSLAHAARSTALPEGFDWHGSAAADGHAPVRHGWTKAPWAVAVDDLIALPILETVDGLAVDLEAVADGRAVVLVYDPDLTGARRGSALARYAKACTLIEAAGAALIVVTPHHPGRSLGDDETLLPLAVDDDHRFAHTLGLVNPAAADADLVAATYVLNDVGAVIWAEVERDWTATSSLSGILPALMALRVSDMRRAGGA